jgi:hypothetical protein
MKEDIKDWEARMLIEHELTDLADCVQLLRMLNWSVALSRLKLENAFIWHEDLDAFGLVIEKLRAVGRSHEDPETRSFAMAAARLYAAVHDALAAGPRQPSEAEVVRRYVAGEIGDRTARYVLGVDAWGLLDVCQRHGLPPIQMGGDD